MAQEKNLCLMCDDQAMPAFVVHRGDAPGGQNHEARCRGPAELVTGYDADANPSYERCGIISHVEVNGQMSVVLVNPNESRFAVEERRPARGAVRSHECVPAPQRPSPEVAGVGYERERILGSRRTDRRDAMCLTSVYVIGGGHGLSLMGGATAAPPIAWLAVTS